MSDRHVMSGFLFICLPIYLINVIWCWGKKGFPFPINVVCITNKSSFDSKWWACLSVAFIMSRVCVCLQGHRSVWAPYCEMWQDAEPSLQKEPRVTGGAADPGGGWRPAMSTPSARCWSRATRPRSETPTAGRCCTSLRRRERSAACVCSSNTEVKAVLGQWRLSVGKKI